MAVAIVLDFEGGSLDQYDRVVEKMGFSPGGTGAPGGMFHWATKTDTGIRVTDVWESAEQFQAFADDQIGPITQAEGLAEPKIQMHEVHNYLRAP